MTLRLANNKAIPPNSSSYWIIEGQFLAGAYPGSLDPHEHRQKLRSLTESGIRAVVNLMEENETDHAGDAFAAYADLVQEICSDAVCRRFAIRDVSIPTVSTMTEILDAIDGFLAQTKPVYVHCWGGVGRTGTVVGCWLLRHGLAEPGNVLDVLRELRQQDQERGYRESPETDHVYGWRMTGGGLPDGRKHGGTGEWVFSEDGKTMTFRGQTMLDAEKNDPLKDVYKRLSP